MDYLILAVWFGGGLLGAVIVWRLIAEAEVRFDERRNFYRVPPSWCPSPKVILCCVLTSTLGLLLLLAAFIVWLAETNFLSNDNWFTRPICRKKDETT